MAQMTRVRFGEKALLIGDGATPEVFGAPCGLNELTRTTNTETETVNLPDCDDPDALSWLGVDEISKQMVITFSGQVAQESHAMWGEWDREGGPKNVRFYTDLLAIKGGGYFEGPAYLTAYEETAQIKRSWNNTGTITFDGKPTWVPAA